VQTWGRGGVGHGEEGSDRWGLPASGGRERAGDLGRRGESGSGRSLVGWVGGNEFFLFQIFSFTKSRIIYAKEKENNN
jgi:hypothetical protein